LKNRILLGVALSIAVTSSVRAAAPINPGYLGALDAVLASCRNVDPNGTAAYKALKISIIGKQSDSTLDAVERTAEYQQGFSAYRAIFNSAPHDLVLKSCTGLIPRHEPRHEKDDRHK
jgi:hypothetical protein